MESEIDLKSVYAASEDVVVRDIEGELIIVPLLAGVGDMETELYSLNETGRIIWGKLDGKKTLKEIGEELAKDYDALASDIEKDLVGIMKELSKRKLVIRE